MFFCDAHSWRSEFVACKHCEDEVIPGKFEEEDFFAMIAKMEYRLSKMKQTLKEIELSPELADKKATACLKEIGL